MYAIARWFPLNFWMPLKSAQASDFRFTDDHIDLVMVDIFLIYTAYLVISIFLHRVYHKCVLFLDCALSVDSTFADACELGLQ